MSWGRVIGAACASAAVLGVAAVAVGMSRAQPAPDARPTTLPSRSVGYPQYAAPLPPGPALGTTPAAGSSSPAGIPAATSSAAASSPAASTRPAASAATSPRPSPARTTSAPPPPRTSSAPAKAPVRGVALPLRFTTGNATRVITVTASSSSSTTAWLQAWTKAPGGGWLKYGSGTTAHVGSDGLTWSPSESKSATPVGSFTLTQAFGYYANPGTGLSYFQTTPADWWISTAGAQYNTHQRCSSCGYGPPDEQLYYETPYYNYAVVINTPSGAAAYPHGSAFFLHVTDGNPTAGCVAIAQSRLVPLMRWLTPGAHPRILIGVV